MRFSFGENWLSYAKSALTKERVVDARAAFQALTKDIKLRNARFLDIGFGQGLALYLAAEAGANAFGIDIDPISLRALEATGRFFPSVPPPRAEIASILDTAFVSRQQAAGGFDVVHSWGVLHHTGEMYRAFESSAALVRPNGFLIVSIYNRHWTSPAWNGLKRIFNGTPSWMQRVTVSILYPLFYLRTRSLSRDGAVWLRGMDIYHDVYDWLGGWPYEYASVAEVSSFVDRLGFKLIRCLPTRGFTGCNEFVFQRTALSRIS